MRRGCVAFLALALAGCALVGCGRFSFEAREPWRAQAEEACLAAQLVRPSAYMSRVQEIDGPGACGITYPYRAQAFAGGDVTLTSSVTLACPIIPEIDGWLARTVRPAAELHLGQAVTGMRAGSYSCRPRNNQSGAKASEHAYGNAIDVFAFRLADGREITVEKGWHGTAEEQDFLREVFVGACRTFTTVLGPGSDAFHYNHFHLDLARHNARGSLHVCRPVVKYEPRMAPDRAADRSPPDAPRRRPAAPIDADDEDPYAASPARAGRSGRAPSGAPVPVGAAPRPLAGAPIQLQPHLAGGSGLY